MLVFLSLLYISVIYCLTCPSITESLNVNQDPLLYCFIRELLAYNAKKQMISNSIIYLLTIRRSFVNHAYFQQVICIIPIKYHCKVVYNYLENCK